MSPDSYQYYFLCLCLDTWPVRANGCQIQYSIALCDTPSVWHDYMNRLMKRCDISAEVVVYTWTEKRGLRWFWNTPAHSLTAPPFKMRSLIPIFLGVGSTWWCVPCKQSVAFVSDAVCFWRQPSGGQLPPGSAGISTVSWGQPALAEAQLERDWPLPFPQQQAWPWPAMWVSRLQGTAALLRDASGELGLGCNPKVNIKRDPKRV